MTDDRRVVVVGSGPPGATAALFLSDAGVEVTLVEAGSQTSAFGITARIAGLTVARWHRPLRQARSGVSVTADPNTEYYEDLSPGGLTNHWSCAVPRFAQDDFDDARRAGEEYVWPLQYADLAPWYDRVEPLLHIAGTRSDTPRVPAGKRRHEYRLGRDWERIGAEANRNGRSVLPVPYAYGRDTTITFSGSVFNSFVRLARPASNNGRLRIVYDARVLRLEVSRETGRVTGVIYRDGKRGGEERVSCRAVVLAAGAINTARILLESSTPTFPSGLGDTDGVLGRYLHDHPAGKIMFDLGRPLSMRPPAYLARPSLDRTDPLYATGCAQWSGVGMVARSIMNGHPGKLPWVGFSIFGTMVPTRENGVFLDSSTRLPDGTPGVKLHIRHPAEARSTLEKARDELEDLFGRAGYSPNMRVWKIENPGSSNHYGGTCRMHASPRYGMLDAWNRLHAVPNVVVVDSAAFTTGPEKNPVLTAMTLSARASDRLARDLRRGDL